MLRRYVGKTDHTHRILKSDHVNYVRFRLLVSWEQMRWKGLSDILKIAQNRPKPANQNIVCNSQFSAL
jgi:hypothetical protein